MYDWRVQAVLFSRLFREKDDDGVVRDMLSLRPCVTSVIHLSSSSVTTPLVVQESPWINCDTCLKVSPNTKSTKGHKKRQMWTLPIPANLTIQSPPPPSTSNRKKEQTRGERARRRVSVRKQTVYKIPGTTTHN